MTPSPIGSPDDGRTQARIAELEQRLSTCAQELAEVRAREERLQFAIEATADGVWDADLITGVTYYSPHYEAMLGYAPRELPTTVDAWQQSIHPDDQAHVSAAFGAYLAGQRHDYVTEHRLKRKDGGWVWVLSRGKVTARDAQGAALRMTGTITDITARRETEARLRTFEALAEHVLDGVSLAHLDGTFFYANPAYKTMTGHREALLNKSITDVYAEPPETLGAAAQQVMAEGAWRGPLTVRRPDGAMLPCEVSVVALKGEDGAPYAFAAITHDLSERIRAEQALRTSEERLRLLITNLPIVLYALDAEGVFTLSDGKGLEALGVQPGQAVGHSVFTLYASVPGVLDDVRRALAGEAFTVIQQVGPIAFETWYSPLRDEQGAVSGTIAIATNVTERLEAEAQRLALQDEVIASQEAALRELSTPLIPLADNIVVMPLVGTIDSRRAQQIMETLLEGIAAYQAEAVLLDISGVRVVDTQVADALLRTARAVKLLGAQVILTGMSPEVAQTVVHLQRGHHHGGADGVDAHPLAGVLHRDGTGEADQAGLGGAIGREVEEARQAHRVQPVKQYALLWVWCPCCDSCHHEVDDPVFDAASPQVHCFELPPQLEAHAIGTG